MRSPGGTTAYGRSAQAQQVEGQARRFAQGSRLGVAGMSAQPRTTSVRRGAGHVAARGRGAGARQRRRFEVKALANEELADQASQCGQRGGKRAWTALAEMAAEIRAGSI